MFVIDMLLICIKLLQNTFYEQVPENVWEEGGGGARGLKVTENYCGQM